MPQALILVDVQMGFHEPSWGRRNNPMAEEAIARLLEHWRFHSAPVYHLQHLSTDAHSPLHPRKSGAGFQSVALPRKLEPVITKEVNSGFIGTDLEKQLHQANISEIVLAGFTTDHCVSTTARMGANLGFKVVIASEATVAFERRDQNGVLYAAELVHAVSLASLHGEFAKVQNNDQLLQFFG
jgi:nicotinamidase-related amidase